MAVNSSSSSFLDPPPECFDSRTNIYIYTSFFIGYTFLLPLFILVLYVGYRQRRKQRSAATLAMRSHSDIIAFNTTVLELIGILGSTIYLYGVYTYRLIVLRVGSSILHIVTAGQTLFHVLTCVERYLAVVHPVTYMKLRQSGGVMIRNISIVCVWLLSFGSQGGSEIHFEFYIICNLVTFSVSSAVISFCSLSVLCVLIRPGPGEVGGNRERVDQSKLRAFYTILAITGALFLRFFNRVVSYVIIFSPQFSYSERCLVEVCTLWFSLPSSLVLPLLFLNRAGKLPGSRHSTESG